MSRRIALALSVALLLPTGLAAQVPGPSLSLDVGRGAGLPILGLWTSLGDRVAVGLEAQADVRTWTRYPDGDPDRSVSGTDWALAAGPAVRLGLARTGSVSLFAHGSLLWGRHRFGPVEGFPREVGGAGALPDPGTELAVQPGLGLDWAVSDRWGVGILYTARWLSGESLEGTADRWRAPRLGFSVRFSF